MTLCNSKCPNLPTIGLRMLGLLAWASCCSGCVPDTLPLMEGDKSGEQDQPSSLDAGGPIATIHYDFESSLQGWQPLSDQRPPDVLDTVEKSSEQHHHGVNALAMSFDGTHTGSTTTPWYGVQAGTDIPPPNSEMTLWVQSSARDVSMQVYGQLTSDNLWTALSVTQLAPEAWTEIIVRIPGSGLIAMGCVVQSSLDVAATIYLDEVSW